MVQARQFTHRQFYEHLRSCWFVCAQQDSSRTHSHCVGGLALKTPYLQLLVITYSRLYASSVRPDGMKSVLPGDMWFLCDTNRLEQILLLSCQPECGLQTVEVFGTSRTSPPSLHAQASVLPGLVSRVCAELGGGRLLSQRGALTGSFTRGYVWQFACLRARAAGGGTLEYCRRSCRQAFSTMGSNSFSCGWSSCSLLRRCAAFGELLLRLCVTRRPLDR